MHYFFKIFLEPYQGSSHGPSNGALFSGQFDVVLREENVDDDECSVLIPCRDCAAILGDYMQTVEVYDLHPDVADDGALLATKRQRTVLVPGASECFGEDLRALVLCHAPHKARDSPVHVGHRRQHPAGQAVKVSISLASRASATSVILVEAEGVSLGAEYVVRLSLSASCRRAEGGCKRCPAQERHFPDRLFVHTDKQRRSKLLAWNVNGDSEGVEQWVGDEAPRLVTTQTCDVTISVRISDCYPRR